MRGCPPGRAGPHPSPTAAHWPPLGKSSYAPLQEPRHPWGQPRGRDARGTLEFWSPFPGLWSHVGASLHAQGRHRPSVGRTPQPWTAQGRCTRGQPRWAGHRLPVTGTSCGQQGQRVGVAGLLRGAAWRLCPEGLSPSPCQCFLMCQQRGSGADPWPLGSHRGDHGLWRCERATRPGCRACASRPTPALPSPLPESTGGAGPWRVQFLGAGVLARVVAPKRALTMLLEHSGLAVERRDRLKPRSILRVWPEPSRGGSWRPTGGPGGHGSWPAEAERSGLWSPWCPG